jgi:Fe-S cluster assembly protein SufD
MRPAREPAWLRSKRDEARARFEELGFPTAREEAWRHTSLQSLGGVDLLPTDGTRRGAAVAGDLQRLGFSEAFKGSQLVFVDGHYAEDLSSFLEVRGVQALPFKQALERDGDSLAGELGGLANDPRHSPAALNTARFEDGLVLRVAPGVRVEKPIHVVQLSSGGGSSSYPRSLVSVGKGSECTLVESYGGPAHEPYFADAVTEVRLDDGASLDHYTLERQGLRATHVAVLAVAQGRDARYANHAINVGGALVRSDVNLLLEAPGADAQLLGLMLANLEQHLDTHTLIDHAQPHGTSREVYKGILNGNARGVFHGRILVRKDAQKTDAQQTNKNLLLSTDALVHSTPQLEILADDVKCKHGSTTGQLDEAALFYLRSRGLSLDAATRLLTFAFASDLVAKIRVAPVRISLEAFLHDRLSAPPREAVA